MRIAGPKIGMIALEMVNVIQLADDVMKPVEIFSQLISEDLKIECVSYIEAMMSQTSYGLL